MSDHRRVLRDEVNGLIEAGDGYPLEREDIRVLVEVRAALALDVPAIERAAVERFAAWLDAHSTHATHGAQNVVARYFAEEK